MLYVIVIITCVYCRYMLELKLEQVKMFVDKVQGIGAKAGCKVWFKFGYFDGSLFLTSSNSYMNILIVCIYMAQFLFK